MPSDPLRGQKFPHCMPVKFLGHADLPFFIPAGLTALKMLIKNLQIDMGHTYTLSLSMDLILFIHDTGSFMHYNCRIGSKNRSRGTCT